PHWAGMALPSRHSLLLIGALSIFTFDCFTEGQKNSTLIFTKQNTIRNCSCSQTSYSGHLTIWFTDSSVLGRLLNFTLVQDLKLSLCSSNTLPTKYLAICGLKRLRISTEAKYPFPEQSLLIHRLPTSLHKDQQTCMYISFLDVALFNRDSSLKSYSIENIASIASDFPDFSYFKAFPMSNNKSYVVTVIY
uniref:Exosomal polycystin 1 interacting protein n=1 Tax=Cavia porcellus TaxID=10141 RepID=A0A286XPJ9_CAVPO